MSDLPQKPPPKLIRAFDDDGREMWIHDPYDAEDLPPDPIMTEPAVNFEVLFQVLLGMAFLFFVLGPIMRWLLISLGLIGS